MLLDLIKQRQSCRDYNPDKIVEKEKIDYLLNCGFYAPSARNRQPWRYVVVEKGEKADLVRKACQPVAGANKFLDNVNTFLVVFERPRDIPARLSEIVKIQDFRPLDVGISTAYVSLAAEEQGLGLCYIGMYLEKQIQKALDVKDTVRIVLAVGYPAENEAKRQKTRRDTVEDVERV